MTFRTSSRPALAAFLSILLAACASMPPPTLSRGQQRPPVPAGTAAADAIQAEPLEDDEGPRAQIRRGTGQVLNQGAAAAPPPNLGGSTGEASFNFEGEPLHAVVKAILGDMLGQNYTIAPGVQGTVTLATPRTVSPAQAYMLLERALADNNARMVYSGGMYQIVPADTALPSGTVAPRTGGAMAARGFEVRVVPLRFISATEMEKVLKPYARPNAIVAVDNGRNTITVSGSRVELENYLRTIEIFDVDWLSGMSVGVFPLQTGKATRVVADLEKVFGEQSKSPVAGMFRFMPLEGANAVLVITPQPDYLDDIQDWLERIDSAGAGARLYSYELKYIKARDLAQRLAEVFGGSSGRGGGNDTGGSLMPGLSPATIGSGGGQFGDDGKIGGDSMGDMGSLGDGGALGSSGSGSGGLGGGSLSLSQDRGGASSVTLEVEGDRVGVSALDETNALLVRTTPQAWKSIREVVERLDVMPLQVHIEAQVAQVQLSGQLEYGVQWFLERAATDNGLPNVTDGAGIPPNWSTLAGSVGGVAGPGLAWTLIRNDAAAIIRALDSVSDVRLLQTPSVFVRNNAEAEFNVGDRIPVSTVSVNPILGSDNSLTSVQYLETGTILKVRPRVTQDGTVFLDIVQEISAPAGQPDNNGNFRITTRRLKTEAAAQDGDTVMLAGLITDGVERGANGIPGLARIPVLGALFGTQTSDTSRSETIVLITARIIRNNAEARTLTDEYSRRFRAMEPLHRVTD
ncbi:type II secretion system secretin GspD [Luteimonas sp. M1R5S18]|uniref:Type II secretion system secretin GspD n=1 Tax=Luteimonas rhizosphaericola TaxID=3042024 RepID=A0ABT6JL56_9GAMM|nr:type II secretion system secretin GspD [Luteimonas rhizosphaericola]MDH5831267.1 type II secretion system secretin GspD [Luteimonas rhizosphaericola]